MTGHGEAASCHGDVAIDVEIRTVNNRFLKVTTKVSDSATAIEPQIENIVREFLKRGSVTVSVRVSRRGQNNAARINQLTLEDYVSQAKQIGNKLGVLFQLDLGQLLMLPGVLETERPIEDETLIEAVRSVLKSALEDLQAMRHREGAAMAEQFFKSLDQIQAFKAQIEQRAPNVIAEYRTKLDQRIRNNLIGMGQEVTELDLLREVLLYADKCDVSEEITRLASHLVQFKQAVDHEESQGRRLDFLIQELFRETNTIGSKANDSQISQWVVSIKTTIEQMRELIQNVE